MSGRIVRVLGRTDYNYSGLGQNLNSGEVPILLDLNVSGAREITLLVRTHAQTLQSTAKFSIITRASAPTAEDPNNYFRDQNPVTTVLAQTSVPIPPTSQNPTFLTRISIGANMGGWLSIFLYALQGATAGQPVTGTFSIDASLND